VSCMPPTTSYMASSHWLLGQLLAAAFVDTPRTFVILYLICGSLQDARREVTLFSRAGYF